MRDDQYDFIGDIHGYAGTLKELLLKLGYQLESFSHPKGRKLVFLGDYIDRGQEPLEVLSIIRGFVDAGNGLAILGNHEYNALAWYTPSADGQGYCRPHHTKNRLQFQETLEALEALSPEQRQDWLEWFRELPIAIDHPHFRAVHACWHPHLIQRYFQLQGSQSQPLLQESFIQAASVEPQEDQLRQGYPLEEEPYWIIEILLKGLEAKLPQGFQFTDKSGLIRHQARLAWWNDLAQDPMHQSLLGTRDEFSPEMEALFHSEMDPFLNIRPHQSGPPIFIGHYWLSPRLLPEGSELKPHFDLEPLAPQVYCLDYSVAASQGGYLVAYRLDEGHAVSVKRIV